MVKDEELVFCFHLTVDDAGQCFHLDVKDLRWGLRVGELVARPCGTGVRVFGAQVAAAVVDLPLLWVGPGNWRRSLPECWGSRRWGDV